MEKKNLMTGLHVLSEGKDDAEMLYRQLCTSSYADYLDAQQDLGEGMAVISKVILGYWKPQFLLDHEKQCAYVFMDENEHLQQVSATDIDWTALDGLPEDAIRRAKTCFAHFPTFIRSFHNGVAMVDWQINPDGQYYMDEDGYGMTPDEEITLYGYIDRTGKVVGRFRQIKNGAELDEMRKQAEQVVVD